MTKVTLKSSALLAALLVAGTTFATTASATTIGGDATSSANLTLKAGTGPVDPLNPTKPDEKIDPVDPLIPGSPGNITVDYGSTFQFGTQTISTQEKTYYAHPDLGKDLTNTVVAIPLYSQVTDQSGDLAGWTLTLTQKEDLHLATGTAGDLGYALKGAQIKFTGGQIVGGNGLTTGAPTDVVASGTLVPGEATKLVSAATNEGAGTWLYNFGALADYDAASVDLANTADKSKVATQSPISLTVPAGLTQKAAAYTTELHWSLQAVPGNAWTGKTTNSDGV
ncbi:cell surface protein [Bacilli bacterium]|nr:cell surface protein [Bacilli bacterium]GHU43478.1 cell surface protein [Bacilli bacterium]GHU46341.1 cell surface protein [Bacilli bacterium]